VGVPLRGGGRRRERQRGHGGDQRAPHRRRTL
jgi:hypothetical protein